MKSFKKYARIVLLGLAFLTLALLVYLRQWSLKPMTLSSETIVVVGKDMRLHDLAQALYSKNVISDAKHFELWTKLQGNFTKFKAGTYQFKDSVTPKSIIDKIVQGDVYNPLVLEFTIPEGFNLEKITKRLAHYGVGNLVNLDRLVFDTSFVDELLLKNLRQLGQDVKPTSLEGFLYPATYRFYAKMPAAKEVFARMVAEFFARLPEHYVDDLKQVKLNLFEAVTIASMIEKETLHEDEKPLVSEVIWRRLKDRVPLAIDATVIYGIRNYDGDIKSEHLKDATNLYNTRVHVGLPPGPIGSPSRSSLEAVLKPASAGNYFYVLMPSTEKKHHFSKTLAEHNRYVKILVEAYKAERQAAREAARQAAQATPSQPIERARGVNDGETAQ